MTRTTFLVFNLAIGCYNTGTIWAHEVDIFRSWRLVGVEQFPAVQRAHWRKLPYWVFLPVGAAIIGAVALIWYHPVGSPVWGIWGVPSCLLLSTGLTVALWGRWQARLGRDPRGPGSPYLRTILRTHWIRTALITAAAILLLAWTIQTIQQTAT